MRIVIAGTRRVPWMASSWSRALREQGHEVHEWDWTPFYSSGLLGRVEQRFLIGPGIARVNSALVETVQEARPAALLLYAASPIAPSTVQALRRHTWVAGYHNDNPFGQFGRKAYFRFWKQSLPLFHSHHVFRRSNVTDYQAAGVRRVRTLLPFYLPWLHVPPSLTLQERQELAARIVFIGHGERDQRLRYVHAMLSAGLSLTIHGDPTHWRQFLPKADLQQLAPIHPVEGTAYARALAAADIALCFFSGGNRDELTFRVFEITALGTFLLCQRTNMAEELFRPDRDAVFFGSREELVDKCKFYLQHQGTRARIASSGRERCLEGGHDVYSRMQQWIADTLAWMQE